MYEMHPDNASFVGARPGVAKQVAILFSDGYSQQNPKEAAKNLRSLNGLELYSVGVDTTWTVRESVQSSLFTFLAQDAASGQKETMPVNKRQLLDITEDEKNTFTGLSRFDTLKSQIKAMSTQGCRY